MKVWSSGPHRVVFVIAAAYLALHVPFLAPSLDDIDSINFALGLRDFDPARHQPHPPGYPVYIALGHISLLVVSMLGAAVTRAAAEATALAFWSAVGGAVAIVAMFELFRQIEPERRRERATVALWATAIAASAPLFWMSGLRPMSDMPGLAAALAAQALILKGRTDRRRLMQGALVTGLAVGIRSQTAWLTMPLLAFVLIERREAAPGRLWRPIRALAGGALAWAVPLVILSGGITGYVRALGSQGGEDLAWVDMLWSNPTPRRLAFSLYETCVLPWVQIPLAVVVAVAAAIGIVAVLVRERRVAILLLVAFVPYLVFHLLFQETIFVRYALPVIPVVAWLAAAGIAEAGRAAPLVVVPLVAASLIVAIPGGVAYRREAHPAFRALADAGRRAESDRPAAVYSHFSVWRAVQAETGTLPVVEPRRQYEWLGPVEYWKNGGTDPIWFIADARRTDLALIDPQSRRDVVRYRWKVAGRAELSGTRPIGVDWYRLKPPGWFVGQGWSLTPETGGLAQAAAMSPDHRPIDAWVRRRPGPMHLVVGGRHLGDPGDPPAQFELTVDGEVRDRWTIAVDERNFLRFLDLPEGIASPTLREPQGRPEQGRGARGLAPQAAEESGGYARLSIASRSVGGEGRHASVAVRQFDIQPADQLVYGYGEGWHEDEFDVPTGLRWRWTSERSVLRVQGPPRAVRITLRGESPLRYFDAPPTVRVTAAGREIARFSPAADFEWSVTVPADDVVRAGGAIALETDRVYLPGQVEGTSDPRHLALRLYECRVDPVIP
jgi:hypothetical protein